MTEALVLASFQLDSICGSKSIHVFSTVLVGECILPIDEQRYHGKFDGGHCLSIARDHGIVDGKLIAVSKSFLEVVSVEFPISDLV